MAYQLLSRYVSSICYVELLERRNLVLKYRNFFFQVALVMSRVHSTASRLHSTPDGQS